MQSTLLLTKMCPARLENSDKYTIASKPAPLHDDKKGLQLPTQARKLPSCMKKEGSSRNLHPYSVSFATSVNVRRCAYAKDLMDNSDILWYTAEEYMKIQKHIGALMLKVQANKGDPHIAPGKICCIWGLERLLQQEVTSAQKELAVSVVLTEQFLQRKAGESDDGESLAVLYTAATQRSRETAQRRGKEQARTVRLSMKRATRHLSTTMLQPCQRR